MTIKARIALGIAFLLAVIVSLAVVANLHLRRVEERSAAAYDAVLAQLDPLELDRAAASRDPAEGLVPLREEIASTYVDNSRQAAIAQKRLTIIGAICALFAVGVLIWLPNYVTKPLKLFASSIERIGAGDLTTRLPENRADEFGLLARRFNQMTSKVQGYSESSLAEILASRNRLTALVDNLTEPILGMDATRRVVFINAPMARYLDLKQEDALGRYMPDLALTNTKIEALFQPIALGQSSAVEELSIIGADGSERLYQERVVRLTGSEADHLTDSEAGYIILLSDVTEYVERTSRQTDFLATLSHEMKTPIAAIKMSLDLLEDQRLGELDEDQLELSTTIRSNNKRLLRMVNEVLQLSQNQAGEVQLRLQEVRLEQLFARASTNLQTHSNKRQIELSLTATSDLPKIEADPERIVWVIQNILSNGIRYAPIGSTISTVITPIAGGVQISVTDVGPGIPREQRARVFEKYSRVDGDKTKGTGLGLAISREYVEAHGGRIFIDPNYNEGVRMVFELPRLIPARLRELHSKAMA